MYKRIITALVAAVLAALLMAALGPAGARNTDPGLHIVARAE